MENQQIAKTIIYHYNLLPNEKMVLIEDFTDRNYMVYAIYVNGQYDRRINIYK